MRGSQINLSHKEVVCYIDLGVRRVAQRFALRRALRVTPQLRYSDVPGSVIVKGIIAAAADYGKQAR